MGEDFRANLSDSAYDFERVVWPVVRRWLGGGYIIGVEQAPPPLAEVLDIYSGIDALRVDTERGVQGIASRVQYVKPPLAAWLSLTIRERSAYGWESELTKRLQQLKDREGRWLVPAYTVQAYVEGRRTGPMKYVCMVRTADLFSFVERNLGWLEQKENPRDGSLFRVVWCTDLLTSGVQLWEEPQRARTHLEAERLEAEERQRRLGWDECPYCDVDLGGWEATCPNCGGVLV